ncbi:SWIM zinc finger family protein [Myceligenerans indicum]|uniref:SWIM zinc finger family protein n=1 Tax=Myceligenerans indicum TaxID=2593663 RepID=A0ABS1LJ22_9MICO|nr:SWIM zinc finger family protein [Myceligenerans indicum]MBL0886221.1 SWIM zinc finger family protein [Myceligenerans indicum]
MDGTWTSAQVEAVAPDAKSLAAARKQVAGTKWSNDGFGGGSALLWGECAGSGKKPYQVCIDLDEPAYKCSCPSRKFPCKHALALLLRWSEGSVAEQAEAAQFADEWRTARAGRVAKKEARENAPQTEAQKAAARRRADERAERVAQGVADLTRWLDDQAAGGIAALGRSGYRAFDDVAARLVDAQAPGLAAAVRRCGSVAASGSGWEERLLAELGLLRLLVSAAGKLDELPGPLADTVRSRLGLAPSSDDVLAGTPVRDTWEVVGLRDTAEDRLTARAVWLRGRDTGRPALVLSFAAAGAALPVDLVPGTAVDADLCFYPGALPLRALARERHSPVMPLAGAPSSVMSLPDAFDELAGALGSDPWLDRYPLVVHGTLRAGSPWRLEGAGVSVPFVRDVRPWELLAAGGGAECPVVVEWTPQGLIPLAVHTADGMVTGAEARA